MRFMNGQTTNDVRKLTAGAAQESCVLNAKGHLEAHLFLFAADDAIWIDADEQLRERLPARLDRYVIADDVLIEDVTEQFALFHVLGETPAQLPGTFHVSSTRLGTPGHDVWCEAAEANSVKQMLTSDQEFLDDAAFETIRVENGIPRWGRELTPEIIPPEANLEDRAIDYDKGCYIGQEVISRMKMSGQTRQRLCGVIGDRQLTAGMELRHMESKPVGKITSAIFSPRLQAHIALAMLKRGFTEPNTELIVAGNEHLSARVTALPFNFSHGEGHPQPRL